jgi:putative iron-regulated protein
MKQPSASWQLLRTLLRRLGWMLLLGGLLAGCEREPATLPEQPSAETIATSPRPSSFSIERTANLRDFTLDYTHQIPVNLAEIQTAVLVLRDAIRTLLATPGNDSLDSARDAWLQAHGAYERGALDRYFANLVLPQSQALELFQLRYRINQWPILPGYLDAVEGYADSGIVNDITVDLTPENLRQQHGAFDLSEATLGFHVIEFLLWGSNSDGNSPRGFEDFVQIRESESADSDDGIAAAQLPANRRRALLSLTSDQLVLDVEAMQILWRNYSVDVQAAIPGMDAPALLDRLMRAMTEMLSEELLVRSLYPMLNGDFEDSIQSPYSHSTQIAVSAQLSGLDRLLLEHQSAAGLNLDALINTLSANFTDFFYQNFDASKECLVLLYNEIEIPENIASTQKTEFAIVECINLVTNMIDHLDQVRTSL